MGSPIAPEEEFHMRLQESGEMYLETILILSRTKNYVRSIDVAELLKVTKLLSWQN